jgi:hypothetical protein
MSENQDERAKPGPPPLPGAKPPAPKPPPLPPQQAAKPTPDGFMTTAAQMSLADLALQLRDEQLEAKVVHYRADLATNAELDAVTAQVIAELQSLQAAARTGGATSNPPITDDRSQLEIELIQNLKEMLGRIFRRGKLATLIERKLGGSPSASLASSSRASSRRSCAAATRRPSSSATPIRPSSSPSIAPSTRSSASSSRSSTPTPRSESARSRCTTRW